MCVCVCVRVCVGVCPQSVLYRLYTSLKVFTSFSRAELPPTTGQSSSRWTLRLTDARKDRWLSHTSKILKQKSAFIFLPRVPNFLGLICQVKYRIGKIGLDQAFSRLGQGSMEKLQKLGLTQA